MNRKLIVPIAASALLLFALADFAGAGGLYVSEFGTPTLGTAGAGAPAGTDGASTAIHNPAAMTQLDEHQLAVGSALAFSFVKFDPDSDTPVAGSNGGNQGGFAPIISGQYVHKLSDRWRLGFALLSISAAILDPSDDWVGRNEITESSLLSLTVLPTLAYRVNDWLSIGAGPTLTYGRLTYELRAPLPGPGSREAPIKLDEIDDFGVGAAVSALLELSPKLRIGVTYNSEIELDLSGDIKLPLGISPNINLKLPLAQSVRLGIHWDVTDRIALLGSAAWEDWSTAESLPIALGGRSTSLPLNFKDTWRGSIGLHYRLNKEWLLQTGFSYDSSALDNSDRTVAFPIDRQTRLAFGALYDWSESTRIGMSFEWLNLGKAKVNDSFVKGDYQSNDAIFFGLNVNWKKLPWSNWGTF